MPKNIFDNYLDIDVSIFDRFQYVVFYGESWSWKTSYINYLKQSIWNNVIVIDEIFTLIDFVKLLPTLISGKKYLIATHIPLYMYHILRVFQKNVRCYNLEKYSFKIWNYLESLWFTYSNSTITQYHKAFKSTYTDVDIIIEQADDWEKDFDKIFRQFLRWYKIKVYPNN